MFAFMKASSSKKITVRQVNMSLKPGSYIETQIFVENIFTYGTTGSIIWGCGVSLILAGALVFLMRIIWKCGWRRRDAKELKKFEMEEKKAKKALI